MVELSKKVRANIIIKLGNFTNAQYGMNITEPLVAELVFLLDPENDIFKKEIYVKHINGAG
jgi:hypothetical protein